MSTNHIDASAMAHALLDGIVGALTARGDLTPEQRQAVARELWAVIASCEPQDALQTMLIGQCLLFNELIATAGREFLRGGVVDTQKPRALSSLNGLNRSLRQNVNDFLKARDKSDASADQSDAVAKTMALADQRVASMRKTPAPVAEAARRADPPARSPDAVPGGAAASADPGFAKPAAQPAQGSAPSRIEAAPVPALLGTA